MDTLKLGLAALLALATISTVGPANAADVKDMKAEQKNVQTETEQKTKLNQAKHTLSKDTANDKNKIVLAKDKVVKGYHVKRLHHETKRGAELTKKIKTEQ